MWSCNFWSKNVYLWIFSSTGTVTLLLTGETSDLFTYLESIDSNGQTRIHSDIPTYPIRIKYGAAGAFIGNKLVICGGQSGEEWVRDCYSFYDCKWSKLKDELGTARGATYGVAINNETLWVTGGQGNEERPDA